MVHVIGVKVSKSVGWSGQLIRHVSAPAAFRAKGMPSQNRPEQALLRLKLRRNCVESNEDCLRIQAVCSQGATPTQPTRSAACAVSRACAIGEHRLTLWPVVSEWPTWLRP